MKTLLFILSLALIVGCGKSNNSGGAGSASSPGSPASNTHAYTLVITSSISYAPALLTNVGASDAGGVSPGPVSGNNTYSITGRTGQAQITLTANGSAYIALYRDGAIVWDQNVTGASGTSTGSPNE